jgi:hypothetical protein
MAKQQRVQFLDTVQMQGYGMLLKGQAAEDERRQIAVVDRQPGVSRQTTGGGVVLSVFIHTMAG